MPAWRARFEKAREIAEKHRQRLSGVDVFGLEDETRPIGTVERIRRTNQRKRVEPHLAALVLLRRGSLGGLPFHPNSVSQESYFRYSLCGDAYQRALTGLLGNLGVDVRFASPTALEAIPDDIDMVVCSGGNVVSSGSGEGDDDEFMERTLELIAATALPLYAISVDMPSKAAQKYLRSFDHVLVRSRTDLGSLEEEFPTAASENVTYAPDVLFGADATDVKNFLHYLPLHPRTLGVVLNHEELDHIRSDELVADKLARTFSKTAEKLRARLAFVPYEQYENPTDPSASAKIGGDEDAISTLISRIGKVSAVSAFQVPRLRNAGAARQIMRYFLAVVVMRYEALVFATQETAPVFAFYGSDSVHKLALDVGMDEAFRHRFETDSGGLFRGDTFDPKPVIDKMVRAFLDADFGATTNAPSIIAEYNAARETVLASEVGKRRVLDESELDAPEDAGPLFEKSMEEVHEDVVEIVSSLTSRSKPFVRAWYEGDADSYFDWDYAGIPARDVARAIIYAVTGSFSSKYEDAIRSPLKDPQALEEEPMKPRVQKVMDAIVGETSSAMLFSSAAFFGGMREQQQSLGVKVASSEVRGPVRIMADVDWISYDGVSVGLGYLLRGLRYLSPKVHGRDARASHIRIDAYVDRTFGWARPTMEAANILPYETSTSDNGHKPWAGFVHHAFDTAQTPYGSKRLFEVPAFLKSLDACVALFALSPQLASDLKTALKKADKTVPVFALDHAAPKATRESRMFSMSAFLGNPDKMLVQLGDSVQATNPYAIYDIVRFGTNSAERIVLKKAVLLSRRNASGSGSYQYFPAMTSSGFDAFFERIESSAQKFVRDQFYEAPDQEEDNEGSICRDPLISRDPIKICRDQPLMTAKNRYVRGMIASLAKKHEKEAVTLSELSEDEYEEMLHKNAVFLNVVDASAIYAVQECIMHNTPVIVNRLPALEHVLGKRYPGFYDNLTDASEKISRISTYSSATTYLKGIDKDRFRLNTFVRRFHDAVQDATEKYFERVRRQQ